MVRRFRRMRRTSQSDGMSDRHERSRGCRIRGARREEMRVRFHRPELRMSLGQGRRTVLRGGIDEGSRRRRSGRVVDGERVVAAPRARRRGRERHRRRQLSHLRQDSHRDRRRRRLRVHIEFHTRPRGRCRMPQLRPTREEGIHDGIESGAE